MADRPAGILRAFACPHGRTGRVVGGLLAIFNAKLNRDAVQRLRLGPGDRVLEIGFGPGVGLREIAARVTAGKVAGIDPSEVMLRQASRRNRRMLDSGRFELVLGSASDLPWPDASFDAALSLNNVLLWDPVDRGLLEVRRVLRPGGLVLLGMRELAARAESPAGAGTLLQVARTLSELLGRVGFEDIRAEEIRAGLGRALLLSARRSRAS